MALPKKKVVTRKPAAKKAVAPVVHDEQKSEDLCSAPITHKLEDNEVLDLSAASPADRLLMLQYLSKKGYLDHEAGDLLEDISIIPYTQYYRLNHVNRLVIPISYTEMTRSERIAQVHMKVDINVDYSAPSPYLPNVIEDGNATYVRVR